MATKADYEAATGLLAMSIVQSAITRRDAYGLAHLLWLYGEKPDFDGRTSRADRVCAADALHAALHTNTAVTTTFRDEVEATRLAHGEVWLRDIRRVHDRMRLRLAELAEVRAQREQAGA